MKYAYTKPTVTCYSRADIMEMLGPVKTQYVDSQCLSCSDARMTPNAILQAKVERVTFSVNTELCPAFRRVRVSIPGSSPFVFYEFDRSDGSASGTRWSVAVDDFQFLGERGNYDVVVTLFDAQGNAGRSCSTTLAIE